MQFPKLLNKQATAIFMKLIDKQTEVGHHNCIYNGKGYMAVHVEVIHIVQDGTFKGSRIVSIAHYFTQNGDMCCDPDMEFLVSPTGAVIPMTFQQAIPPVYQQALRLEGDKLLFNAKVQASITSFANQWMRNIADQQDLDAVHKVDGEG